MRRARVVVINQFAMPRTHWGLTRHAVLFSLLERWDTVIFAGARDHYSQKPIETDDPLFTLTGVPSYKGSAFRRVLSWVWFSLKAFAYTVRQTRLDLVYASSPHLLGPLAGALAARLRRVPFVLEIRDLHPESLVEGGAIRRGSRMHRLLERLESALYRHADEIVVVTSGWEEHLQSQGADLGKVTVVPNGVDVDAMTVDESKAELRVRLGLAQDRPWCVYAGAHGLANGLDQLLDAAAELPDIGFLLIGDGNEKAALMQRAAAEELRNVRFLDPVPKDQLAMVLGAADLGLHVLAPWELLQRGLSPNKIYDYMAAGLPVVSNCGAGLQGLAQDGECGRFGGVHDLGDLIRAAVQDEARHAEWAARAREIVSERFSRAVAADHLSAVLERAQRR